MFMPVQLTSFTIVYSNKCIYTNFPPRLIAVFGCISISRLDQKIVKNYNTAEVASSKSVRFAQMTLTRSAIAPNLLIQVLQYDWYRVSAKTETPRHPRTAQFFTPSPACKHAPSTILLCCIVPRLESSPCGL